MHALVLCVLLVEMRRYIDVVAVRTFASCICTP